MQDFILTAIDTTGIQDYIFGSNTLRENIGGSHLVEQVRRTLLIDTLPKNAHNVTFDLHTDVLTIADQPLENNPSQLAEVIYCGGGNILILFRSEDDAKGMVRRLTRALLREAPGLEVTAAHYLLKAAGAFGGLEGAYNQLLSQLNQSKQQRRKSLPLLSLGVTLECRSTGLPAVTFDKPPKNEAPRPVSTEISAKGRVRKEANARLRRFLRNIAQDYTFSDDFDDFGRSRGEASYIAVIHADGNGIGNRFQHLVELFPNQDQNRTCINALRQLSVVIETIGRTALQQAVKQLVDSMALWWHMPKDTEERRFVENLQWKEDDLDYQKKHVLPVRPLVFGGDDVTLVCDGRLGLTLAAAYLDRFEHISKHEFTALGQWFNKNQVQLQASEVLNPACASAGITIVKAHYPFRRAYDLATALCRYAKSELKAHAQNQSALDWHFASTGITAGLNALRGRSYQSVDNQSLLMRPVTLHAPGLEHPWRTWRNFSELLDTFKNQEPWRGRRNKVIALREALRQGKEATRQYLVNYTMNELPNLHGAPPDIRTYGFADERSGYFDTIEAIDLFLPLLSLDQLALAGAAAQEVPA